MVSGLVPRNREMVSARKDLNKPTKDSRKIARSQETVFWHVDRYGWNRVRIFHPGKQLLEQMELVGTKAEHLPFG